jgi:hypothetical protein
MLQHPKWGVDVFCDREPKHQGGHLGVHPADHRQIVGWTDENTCNDPECRHETSDKPMLFEECHHWHASECELRECGKVECPSCGHRFNPEEDE